MTDRTGQCMCGAVRFSARNVTAEAGACHCKMCQRWAGAVLIAVTVPATDIDWTGLDIVGRIQSSDWAERAWCTKCGTGLWYRVTAKGPDEADYEMPIGIFDDANGFDLTREIFFDRKPDSFALEGAHKLMTEAESRALYGATAQGA